MTKKRCFIFGFVILLIVSLLLIGCTSPKPENTQSGNTSAKATSTTATSTTTLTATSTKATSTTASSTSEGQKLVETRCTVCHNTQRIYAKKRDAAEWGTLVDLMISRGAVVSNANRTKIINYLAGLNQ